MADTTLRELVYGKGGRVDPMACVDDISALLARRTVANMLRRQFDAWPPERGGDSW